MARKSKGKAKPSSSSTLRSDVFEAEDEPNTRKGSLNKILDFIDSGKGPRAGGSDDEEIDEDEAFNEEDELLYGDILGSRDANGTESGEESEIDEDEENAGLLLTDILDKNLAKQQNKQSLTKRLQSKKLSTYDSDSDQGDYGSEESDVDESDSEDEDEAVARSKMLRVAERLSQSGKKRGSASTSAMEETEVGDEGEYNIKSTGTGKVNLESMMGTLTDSKSHGLLKKRLDKMEEAEVIDRPESRPAQERADRKVGFKEAKEQVTRWQGVVKANRESKSLSFPLNQSGRTQATTKSMSTQFVPKNSLEEQIQRVLEESGLSGDGAVMKKEEEHLKSLVSKEEMKRKHGELAKLRMLMYYEEKKAKRVKKIKSKMYRKLLKRKRAREEEKEHARIREMDPEGAKKLDEEAALKRAEERMSLRHKNTSKFMRNLIKNRGAVNEDTREIVSEQLQREAQLKRKMVSMNDDSDDEESLGDTSDSDIDENGRAKGSSEAVQEKGIMALKFMQRGRDRRNQALREEEQLLKRALDGDENSDSSEDEAEVRGRKAFRPTGKRKNPLLDLVDAQAGEQGGNASKRSRSSGILGAVSKSGLFKVAEFDDEESDSSPEDKPKVSKATEPAEPVGSSKKSSSSPVSLPAGTASVLPAGKSDKTSAQSPRTEQQSDDEEGDDIANPWLQDSETKSKDSKANKKVKFDVANMGLNTENVASLGAKAKGKSASGENEKLQVEVMQRAFANAVSEEDFANEKAEIDREEEEKRNPKPVVVAGWGSWTGAGVVPPKPKRRRRETVQEQAPVKPAVKSNAPKHVIVSKKQNKKAAKYTLDKVPYPFTSREQYERSLQVPLGNDWNTQRTFKEGIKAAVKVKKGAIVEPIKFTNAVSKMGDGKNKVTFEKLQRNARKKEKRLQQRNQRKKL